MSAGKLLAGRLCQACGCTGSVMQPCQACHGKAGMVAEAPRSSGMCMLPSQTFCWLHCPTRMQKRIRWACCGLGRVTRCRAASSSRTTLINSVQRAGLAVCIRAAGPSAVLSAASHRIAAAIALPLPLSLTSILPSVRRPALSCMCSIPAGPSLSGPHPGCGSTQQFCGLDGVRASVVLSAPQAAALSV